MVATGMAPQVQASRDIHHDFIVSEYTLQVRLVSNAFSHTLEFLSSMNVTRHTCLCKSGVVPPRGPSCIVLSVAFDLMVSFMSHSQTAFATGRYLALRRVVGCTRTR